MQQTARERLASLLPRIHRLRVPIIIGILLLVPYVVLGFAYIRSVPQQNSLRSQLAQFNEILRSPSRLKDVEAEFTAIQEGIPPAKLMEIDVFRTMQELVSQSGLDPAKLKIGINGQPQTKMVGKTPYRLMNFSMTVSGDYKNVWALVQKLDRGETSFRTLVLNKTSVVFETERANATMDFTIYTAVR
ncbi:MAG: hypothetical protein HYU30_09360 [Chloroflexi bacterium]|nr:hypothetical protein [Chloroflexota bacterium]